MTPSPEHKREELAERLEEIGARQLERLIRDGILFYSPQEVSNG